MSKGPDWTAQVRNKRRIPPPLPVEPPSGSYVGFEVGWCGVSRETLLHFLYEEGLLICSIVCTPLILQQRGLLQRSRESTRKRRSSHHAICVHSTKATHDRGPGGARPHHFWNKENTVHIGFCDYGLSGQSGFSDRKPLDGPPSVHK